MVSHNFGKSADSAVHWSLTMAEWCQQAKLEGVKCQECWAHREMVIHVEHLGSFLQVTML